MGSSSKSDCSNPILISDSLSQASRQILALSKAYQTIILLYDDDLSEKIQAAWAEKDRLNLTMRKVGEVLNGIEVFTFGMEPFSPNMTLELNLREASQDPSRQDPSRTAYKSLLNELILIQVSIHPASSDSIRLQ